MARLQLESASLAYGDRILMSPLCWQVAAGQVIGIIGKNGAGKSTLLKAILGVIPWHQGRCLFDGKPLTKQGAQVGYMPQLRLDHPPHQLNVQTYLKAVQQGTQWGCWWRSRSKGLDEISTYTDIRHLLNRPYTQLSGGERQRVALAQALCNQPQLLLLDEPLASLDPRQQAHMVEILQQIRQHRPMTILLTTHDIRPLLPLLDGILALKAGRAEPVLPEVALNQSWAQQFYHPGCDHPQELSE